MALKLHPPMDRMARHPHQLVSPYRGRAPVDRSSRLATTAVVLLSICSTGLAAVLFAPGLLRSFLAPGAALAVAAQPPAGAAMSETEPPVGADARQPGSAAAGAVVAAVAPAPGRVPLADPAASAARARRQPLLAAAATSRRSAIPAPGGRGAAGSRLRRTAIDPRDRILAGELPPAALPAVSYDARVRIESLEVRGAVSAAVVRQGMGRLRARLRACYRHAARDAARNHHGSLLLALVLDETGRPAVIDTRGGGLLPGLEPCLATRLRTLQVAPPGGGRARVSLLLRFYPARG